MQLRLGFPNHIFFGGGKMIPGTLPKDADPFILGKAAGELCKVPNPYTLHLNPNTHPYTLNRNPRPKPNPSHIISRNQVVPIR